MTLTEFLLAELEREVPRSRRALEQVPEGHYDWRPHEKSMTFGYLADLVATMPAWLAMMITTPDLDIAPADGSSFTKERKETSARAAPGAGRGRRGRPRGARRHHGRPSAHDLAAQGSRAGRGRGAAPRDDPGRPQPLGAPSRPDDRVPAAAGCEGAGALRSLGRRQELRLAARSASRIERRGNQLVGAPPRGGIVDHRRHHDLGGAGGRGDFADLTGHPFRTADEVA